MNVKVKKVLKLIYSIIVMFVLINVFIVLPSYCSNASPLVATIGKIIVAGAQVAVSGFFIIRFTMNGIAYFTAVAASDKADNKNRMMWTLLEAVTAYLLMFMFSKAIGL